MAATDGSAQESVKTLLMCIGLQIFWASAAWARPLPPVVRLGTVVDTSAAVAADLEALVLPNLAPGMHLTGQPRYMAMADQLGVLWPYTPRGARRVGRRLHLTHVAVLQQLGPEAGHQRHAILRVRLVDVRTGQIPVNKRFLLTAGHVTPATAARITAALRWMLLAERARAGAPLPHDPRKLPGSDGKAATEAPGPGQGNTDGTLESDAEGEAGAAAVEDDGSPPWQDTPMGRKTLALGPALRLRGAYLGPAEAPCYCADGGFAPAVIGLALDAKVYFDPEITHFGFEVTAGGGYAPMPTQSGSLDNGTHTLPWYAGGNLGYRFFDTSVVSLVPRASIRYERFPVAQGGFVGTAYTLVALGAAVVAAPLGRHFAITAEGDFGIVAAAQYEMQRLGHLRNGTHFRVALAPQFLFGRLTVVLQGHLAQARTSYSGQTSLYGPQDFVNVGLVDTTLGFNVQLGGQFW